MTERTERLTSEEVTRIAMASMVFKPAKVVTWWNEKNPQNLISRREVYKSRELRASKLPIWTAAPREMLTFLESECLLPSMSPLYRLTYLEEMADYCMEGATITTSGPKGDTIQVRPDYATGVRAMELISKEMAMLTPQSTPEPIQITHKGRTLEAVS